MNFRHLGITVLFVLSTWGEGTAQVATGTLFQSVDPFQGPGVGQILLPGNPSITTNELMAWSSTDTTGMRSLFNAQALALLFGDQDGNGLLADLPNIDALAVSPIAAGFSPSPYDFRLSVSVTVFGLNGIPIITPGDVFSLAGNANGYTVVINRAQIQAALGTTQQVNVDAYAELPDGSVLVSLEGIGSGTNIISPLSGAPGFQSWTGADVFILRQPVGLLPAIFAYRQSELQPITQAVLAGYNLQEIVGLELQPNTSFFNNPWDPTNLYANGGRPDILWTVSGDENVICSNPVANPLGFTNVYALCEGNQGAGYSTNTANPNVSADALAFSTTPIPTQSRITVDHSNSQIPGGSPLTLTVRSPLGQGETFQLVVTTLLEPGVGLPVSNPGYPLVHCATFDPLLFFSLQPPLSTILQAGPTDAAGTATTIPITMPFVPTPLFLYFQAFRLGGNFPLSSPLAVLIQ